MVAKVRRERVGQATNTGVNMQVRKTVAGSVIGVGLGAMAFAGAGMASADTGYGGKPGGGNTTVTKTTTIKSFNTITKNYDDHSVNLFNGVSIASGNTVLSGNTTSISVLNNNKFLNNLGSGANVLSFSTNLHNSVKVWTKVGNGNTGLVTPQP
jgi:hypothetical protein